MRNSLRKKLALSYMLVALICIVLISGLANLLLEKQFKNYIIKSHEKKSADIIKAVSEQYEREGKWNDSVLERIGINALENGLIIKIEDLSGNAVWDARVHNNGMCEAMINHFSHNMMNRYSNWKGGFVNNKSNIIANKKKVGTVEIGYYGPYYYSDNDLMFLNTLNKLFIVVGTISLVFALIIGVLMSGALSRPILKVIHSAESISEGNYSDRINEVSNINEIDNLIESINGLASDLETQESLRKRLTSDVAHELRTPLATLQSHMEAIIDGVWEPTIDRIKSCHEETLRINRMVGDLERLAQYESENLVLNKKEFNISDVISSIIMNFENEFLNKNVIISFKRTELKLFADKDKVSQVIVNLISNALKYTLSGGKVDILVFEEKEYIGVSIRDSGIGISQEDLPNIFERFYRADKSRNRHTGGAGIGLTITKAIIDAHKGKITAISKLNEGTEFRVLLPK
jgi:two-component system, OmpR family, sensor histidine kinase BaeS